MKYFWTLCLTSFLCGGVGLAQPKGEPLQQRQLTNSSAVGNEVFTLAYDNPSLRYLWPKADQTEIYLGGIHQQEDLPQLVQEGTGQNFAMVDVVSFLKKKNYSLWGQAYYKNGKLLDRCWNETSDYQLLYPYVMGDTLGGSLKSEQYYFSGGCAYRLSRYVIGIAGSYKASIDYRNADPRPKNLTGDLNARIGVSRYLGEAYQLGLDISARKYKQTNDLVFYDELGVPNIYHFTGLGSDYYRFRGAKGESFYKGRAFGGGLALLPTTSAGLSAAVHYNRFQFEKVISSLNELPMAMVKEDQLQSEIAWKDQRGQGLHKGVRCGFDYTRRIGQENIFGAPSGNIFPQIGSQEKYMNKIYAGKLAGMLEYTFVKGTRLSLIGQANYFNIETTYLFPSRGMELAFTTAQLDFRVVVPFRKWMLSGQFGAMSKFRHHSSLDLGKLQQPDNELLNTPAIANYEGLRATCNRLHTQLRTDYSWNDKYGVFLGVDYQYGVDGRDSKLHCLFGQMGFTF